MMMLLRCYRPRLAFLVFAVGVFLGALGVFACTPQDRASAAGAVVPAERAACVLLRLAGVGEYCATADELAPYAADLLAGRRMSRVTAPRTPVATLTATAPVHALHCVEGEEIRGRPTDRGPRSGDGSSRQVDGGE